MTENTKSKVIERKDIMDAMKMHGPIGWCLSSLAMSILGLNRANRCFARNSAYEGPEFSRHVLEDLGISCDLIARQLDNIPSQGAFITISNHAFGGADGLLLSSLIGSRRPDYKILTNFILSMIPTLRDSFLPVNPFTNGESRRKSIDGLRMALEHLDGGGSLGLFPSGEVATYHGHAYTEEVPWPSSMIKLIRNRKVTVVPVYFDGENSRLFHFLGRIHPILRTARLPRELFNKKGRNIPVRIGKPITPSEIAEYDNIDELGSYLRARVYALQAQVGETAAVKKNPKAVVLPVAQPKPQEDIMAEIESIERLRLFEVGSYSCYLASYDDIPNLIHELGRAREITFRANNEGTDKPLDLDGYDRYYKHLILWHNRDCRIAGAYRLGIGSDIFAKGGAKAFYSSDFYDYKPEFDEVLKKTIELGRSFVVPEYQGDMMPLMLLFKGLMHTTLLYPDAEWFNGPMSISNAYPLFYQSLIAHYITERHSSKAYRGAASPQTPFKPDFLRVDKDALLGHRMDSIEKFDRALLQLSDREFRLPPLVRKYLKNNAELLCFNVDPDFNYSLDGLILMRIKGFSRQELDLMMKDVASEVERRRILERLGYSE